MMQKNKLHLGIPSYLTLCTSNETIESPLCESSWNREDIHIEFIPANEQLTVSMTSIHTPLCWLKIRWPMEWPDHVRFLGDAWERGYGDLEWKGMSANRFMPWYFAAATPQGTSCYGVKVRPSALCFWQADSEGLTLVLDVRSGGDGVILNGRILEAAEIIASHMQECTSFEALSEFCGEMCPDPIFPDHPVYGSNNWYYAYGNSSQEEILQDCDYLLSLTEGTSNKPYMVIDDCWQEHHRLDEYNGGPWREGNRKFPDMKGLADQLIQKGVRTGIWVRLLLNEDTAIPEEWRLSHNGCLDPSHPDALQYIMADVERICGWGYRLLKHDFSTFDLFGRWGFEMNPLMTGNGWHFYDQSMTSAEVVKLLYRKIHDICRKYGTLVLGCNTIGHLGAGLMHINRTGDDTSGKNWERSRRMGVNTLAFRLPQHKKFYDVDADCVGIDGPIDWKFNKQWADVIAESGTPLFVSAKPGLLKDIEKEELRRIMLVASSQEHHLIPKDWEDTDCPVKWEDAVHGIARYYHWFEESGVKFSETTVRCIPYLSIVE